MVRCQFPEDKEEKKKNVNNKLKNNVHLRIKKKPFFMEVIG